MTFRFGWNALVGIVIAPAKPVQADLAAALIHDTDRHIFDQLCGGDLDLSRRHLGAQWLAPTGLFWHRMARVAWDGADLVGLQIGYTQEMLVAAVEPFGALCTEIMSEAQKLNHDRWWGTYGHFSLPAIPHDT